MLGKPHVHLKFLTFAAATLLCLLSSPRPLFGTTLNAVAFDSKAQTTQDSEAEAERLSQEGINQLNRGQLPEAAHTFEQALEIYRKLGALSSKDTDDSAKKLEILKNLVVIYTSLRDSSKVIEVAKVSWPLARQLGERETELKLLMALGDAYNSLEEYEQAVESAKASLALAEELQNSQAKAASFVTLARAYQFLASSNSEYHKAAGTAISGLTTAWTAKDYQSEAKALGILSSVYSSLNKERNAIIFAQQALKVAKENNIPTEAASSLLTLANIHLENGEYQEVIEYAQQARDYLQKLHNREAEGAASVMQGLAYLGQGNSQQSIKFAEQGLAISREVESPLTQALAIIVLSLDYSNSGNPQKAIELINQSRVIAREQNNRALEALTLEVQGVIYRDSGQKKQAIASYQESRSIADSYSATAGLARLYRESNLVGTAITYYKQAVNKNELQVQRSIPGLPVWLKRSFPQAIQDMKGVQPEDIYRSLTQLLLSERRVGEVQPALELLKQQELREYTGDTTLSDRPASLTIRPNEEQIIKEYGSLINFGKKLDECQRTRCPQIEQLSQQRAALNENYYQALGRIETKIHDKVAGDEAFVDPSQFSLKAQEILQAQPGTVLIYPLVLEDKISLIWASEGGIFKSVEVDGVSQAQVEKTVLRFRQLLQNRLSNIEQVKATGKQLYDWLIAPLEKELKANNIHNLVFSLDRSTRYIPMSALFDGEKYLMENYTISTVLSANLTDTRSLGNDHKDTSRVLGSKSALSDTQNTVVLGLGVSDPVAGFKPLPNVPAELSAIVRQNGVDTQGVFPGQQFLNKGFDFFALRDNVSSHPIVHIATHAKFVPGEAYQSYLVLGTGEKLEIPEIESWLNLRDVDLVVLSACETALGGPGLDGREIAGIGYYFLKGGAKTVMASLWSVDDRSTRMLMEQFYKNLAKGTPSSPVTKAEALRQAQLVLLRGNNTADASLSVEQQRDSQLPAVKKSRFRHPFYWSPFILMGSGL